MLPCALPKGVARPGSGLGVEARQAIRERREQPGGDRRPLSAAGQREVLANEHADPSQAAAEAEGDAAGQRHAQPERADRRSEERRSGVENRQQRGRQRLRGVGKEQEGERRVEDANAQKVLPQAAHSQRLFQDAGDQPEEYGGDADAKHDQRHRTEGRDADAHEQKRSAPDRSEQEQSGDTGSVHAGLS
jgi:hypothetical protein